MAINLKLLYYVEIASLLFWIHSYPVVSFRMILPTTTFLNRNSVVSKEKYRNQRIYSKNDIQYPFDADTYEAEEAKKKALQASVSTRRQKNSTKNSKDDPEWQFFDTARMNVSGGNGGNGCVAFRREKGEARGGPSGGRGGNGGSIYLICDDTLNTLAPIRNRVHVRARNGNNGIGKGKDGKKADDIHIRVPPGTLVRDLVSQKLAGELRTHGETLLVARGGRGGRGNAAFMTPRNTGPKLAERGEPGASRWLSVELRLVADVGFLGKPNAGKSTLLKSASAAKPKIADYPFTTIVPNLGVCDIGDEGAGLILCDIPGLIEGAANGSGLGPAFLRHVQRCKVLLHVIDGTSEDPIHDFITINKELKLYDEYLSQKPQVVVINKVDVPAVQEIEEELKSKLQSLAGHTRILTISAATSKNVKELMGRLKKFVAAQPEPDLPPPPEIDFNDGGFESDRDDFEVISDPAYPGQWRVKGGYIEQVAKMTHWEYPEAIERFGRQLIALGIADELQRRGAVDGDLVMVDEYDFEFSPGMTNPYIPTELLERDILLQLEHDGFDAGLGGSDAPRGMLLDKNDDDDDDDDDWMDDVEELIGFNEDEDWDMLEEEFEMEDDDEIWTS